MEFEAFEPGIDVNGQTILSVVSGLGKFEEMGLGILEKNGIADPQPDKWYSQQAWLNAFKFISEKLGPYTLRQIGQKIPENADWPPQIKTIKEALASIDVAYHMNHRKEKKRMFNPQAGKMAEGIGHYIYKEVSEKEVKMILDNPYPCEFDKGIIEAVAKKFSPDNFLNLSVTHSDTDPCRKKEGDTCTLIIKW